MRAHHYVPAVVVLLEPLPRGGDLRRHHDEGALAGGLVEALRGPQPYQLRRQDHRQGGCEDRARPAKVQQRLEDRHEGERREERDVWPEPNRHNAQRGPYPVTITLTRRPPGIRTSDSYTTS